jgi:hypothetical protein
VDGQTKWAELELRSISKSIAALAKKMTKSETKTVTQTVAVPKTKIVKQLKPRQKTLNEQTSSLFVNSRYN